MIGKPDEGVNAVIFTEAVPVAEDILVQPVTVKDVGVAAVDTVGVGNGPRSVPEQITLNSLRIIERFLPQVGRIKAAGYPQFKIFEERVFQVSIQGRGIVDIFAVFILRL